MAKLKHCQFAVCVPIKSDPAWLGMKVEEVERRLKALKNPAGEALVNALNAERPRDVPIIHFMSASVVWDGTTETRWWEWTTQARAHLVLDITGDGVEDGSILGWARWMIGQTNESAVIAALVRRAGTLLLPVFESACGIQSLSELERCLNRCTLMPVTHPFSSRIFRRALGLPFQGTPGLSVRRIKDDDAIERIARESVEQLRDAERGAAPRETDDPKVALVVSVAVSKLRDEKRAAAPRDYLECAREALRAKGRDFTVPETETQVGDPGRPKQNIFYAIFSLSFKSWLALILEFVAFVAIVGLAAVVVNPSAETVEKLTARLPVLAVLGVILVLVLSLLRAKVAWSPVVAPVLGVASLGVVLGLLFSQDVREVAADVGVMSVVAWMFVIMVVLMSASLLAALAGFLISRLRLSEKSDKPVDRDPDAALVQAIMARENPGERIAQNHVTAVSTVKPGLLRRWVMLRLGLHLVELAVQSGSFARGFLSNIGTIHFAQWVRIPGKKLLFFSNYDGSWESYLEDFITKASSGLTIVWSNATDFPKTNWLYQDGATDGDRFKRWVRRQQIPTLFWYSAYPSLTAEQIRLNARIRYGLARAESGSEAEEWLGYFTSSPRPARAIETHEIQRLVFDGLREQHDGACLPVHFPAEAGPGAGNAWLGDIVKRVAFGDQPPRLAKAVFVALSWRGLEKLGLASGLAKAAANGDGGATAATLAAEFPLAFVLGMDDPTRRNPLGDLGDCEPDKWGWGGPRNLPLDAVLLIYAPADAKENGIDQILGEELERIAHHRLKLARKKPIRFRRLPEKGKPMIEPFGFVDGISQPIIKGVDRWAKNVDPLNQVNAGEFILGYRDGRDRYPPTPQVSEAFDREKDLPNLPPDIAESKGEPCPKDLRDLGRNGSYLVIRQLEQDVAGFNKLLDHAASEVQPVLDYKSIAERKEWVAAKMMGRWRNGSSLARFPHGQPGPDERAAMSRTIIAPLQAFEQPISKDEPSKITEAVAAALAKDAAGGSSVTVHDATSEQKVADQPDNEFLYGRDDPQGLRCPLGAHIRRANPRDSFAPGDPVQIAITNRHRLLRRARVYDEMVDNEEKMGLLFMCLNADIERQFEFVQQAWLSSNSFEGLRDETDPFVSRPRQGGCFTIPTPSGPIHIKGMRSYVTMRGGGYFFLPSRRALRFLCNLRSVAATSAELKEFCASG